MENGGSACRQNQTTAIPLLMRQTVRPDQRLANRVRKLLKGLVWRWSDRNDYIDHRQHQRSEVIRMHGNEHRFS